MAETTAKKDMQSYLESVGERGMARGRAVFKLGNELLAYRSARAALTGPALADWTARYEENLRKLVAHAVDSLNDVFDTGSWPRILRLLSSTSKSAKSEELMSRVQASVATDFGDQARESIGVLTALLTGMSVASAPSSAGVRITVSHKEHKRVTFELASQRAMGDVARTSSVSLLGGRPPLLVQRTGGLRQPVASSATELGTIDFYGAFVAMCNWLLDNARREVRASQRYGRVRVQGEAPIVIFVVAVVVLVGLIAGYVIACTGSVEPDNASNQNTTACNVLVAIVALVAAIAIALAFPGLTSGTGTTGGGLSGGGSYNLNPPGP
jgi:hypothetical protein